MTNILTKPITKMNVEIALWLGALALAAHPTQSSMRDWLDALLAELDAVPSDPRARPS